MLEALVVGPWGNGSKDLHSLVKVLVESRLAAWERVKGRAALDWELGLAMGQIRWALSLDFVWAQSLCLLSWLCHLGEGAWAAVARGLHAGRQEESSKPTTRLT